MAATSTLHPCFCAGVIAALWVKLRASEQSKPAPMSIKLSGARSRFGAVQAP
jgi:hypothetical protein